MYICPRCKKEFESYNSLSKHTRTAYKLSGELLYREYHNITKIPVCKCGCGTPTKWRVERGYGEYVNGHNAKGHTNPMFGKSHTQNAKKNISKKRKEKFANGEYEIWQHKTDQKYKDALKTIGEKSRKENNPERARKISEALTGVPHSKERTIKTNASIKKAWENEELRERQRENILDRFFNKKKNEPSNLELIFCNILDSLKIQYQFQYELKHRLFDFKLVNHNILIEVDGDFYHCNPNKHPFPIYQSQKTTIKNDLVKNKLAKDNGFVLLRFWESDINERPTQVVSELLKHLS
jgi:very-short-patch-repair endonuclease